MEQGRAEKRHDPPTIDRMKLSKIAFPLLVLVALLASCVGRRNINYLEDPALSNTAKLFPNKKFEYRIQVNDVLSIRVLGLNDETARFFNVEGPNGTMAVSDAGLSALDECRKRRDGCLAC